MTISSTNSNSYIYKIKGLASTFLAAGMGTFVAVLYFKEVNAELFVHGVQSWHTPSLRGAKRRSNL